MSEANKALFRRWIQEVWNDGREASIDELSAPEVVGYGLGDVDPVLHGAAAFKAFWANMRGALAPMRMNIEDLIAEGDKVVGRVTMEAVHSGDQLGAAASGKNVRVAGMIMVRFENGLIVEAWNSWDQLGLLRQMGALETPPADGFVRTEMAS